MIGQKARGGFDTLDAVPAINHWAFPEPARISSPPSPRTTSHLANPP
jgi:hypothetical protein